MTVHQPGHRRMTVDAKNSADTAVVLNLNMLNRQQRYRGVRAVASAAHDAADCRQLLEALGLDPADGRSPDDDGSGGPSSVSDLAHARERRGVVRRRVVRRQP